MKGFYVSPRTEFLMAAVLTVTITQHAIVYFILLVVAAIILPSARMGDRGSFAFSGICPLQRGLFLTMLPLAFVVATLDFYGIGAELEPLCPKNSLCSFASSPIKGFLFLFYTSSIFIFALLRANHTFKPFSLFDSIVSVLCSWGIYVTFLFLIFPGNAYTEMLIFTVGGIFTLPVLTGVSATYLAFFFSDIPAFDSPSS